MRTINKTLATAAFCTSVLLGCSNDSSAPPPDPFARVDLLAAQTATLSIADPGGASPTVTITQPADVELSATVTTPGAGGAGTIDVTVTATNNATRGITNFKAIVNSTDSTLGTATIAGTGTVGGSGSLAGEIFIYLDDILVTAAGKTGNPEDDLRITLGGGAADPLEISLILPTEDVGLITTDNYYGEEEIIAIDTGVGGIRTIGITSAYVFVDFDDSSSYAANATEGVLSPDGRYAYLGHKTNPYIMILDTETGTVDAVELLPPPETPNPSGAARRIGSVDSVVMSPDGMYLYASVLDGAHPYNASGCAYDDADGLIVKNYIMKIKIDGMELMGQLNVTPVSATCDDTGVLKRISLDSDGKIGAAAIYNRGRVAIFDTTGEMSLMKSVIVNGPADDKNEPHYTAVSPDGSKVYVAYNGNTDNLIDIIDTDDFSISHLTPTTSTSTDAADLRFGPDGRLYYARRWQSPRLSIFDVDADPVTEVEIDMEIGSNYTYGRIAFDPFGNYYYYNTCSGTDLYKLHLGDDPDTAPIETKDTVSADSPIDSGTCSYHLMLPTKY